MLLFLHAGTAPVQDISVGPEGVDPSSDPAEGTHEDTAGALTEPHTAAEGRPEPVEEANVRAGVMAAQHDEVRRSAFDTTVSGCEVGVA